MTTIAGPGGGGPFRTFLPDRGVDSGRVFRDVRGIEGVYQLLGSDPGLDQWRGEMGIIPVHDMQASMGTQLAEQDSLEVSVDTGAADTTAQTIFSFPSLPSGGEAAHHRIQLMGMRVTTPANFSGADLSVRPFGDPTWSTVAFVDPASVFTIAGLTTYAVWSPQIAGLWGRRQVDYRFRVRSGAGGATVGLLQLLVAMVPPGVAVPR